MIWYYVGKFYFKRKNYRMAAKYLDKSNYSFQSPEDYVMLAESLHNIDQSEKAIKVLKLAFEKYPSISYLYERRSHLLREMYREEEAIADLNEAIRLNPKSYINWYTRGLAYKDLGFYEEAIRDLKESIKREDSSTVVSTYYELAMAYYQSGNLTEAADYFMKTIHTPAAIPVYYYMLSTTLHQLNRTEEAIPYLLEGIIMLDVYEARPDRGYAIFAHTTSYSYGAFKTFQRVIEPTYSFRKDLAEMYAALGKYDLAIEAINHAIKNHPNTIQLYLIRANIYEQCEQWENAHDDIQKAIQLDPDNVGSYLALANLFRIQGEGKRELSTLLKLLDATTDNPVVYYRVADAYYRLQQFEEALNFNNKLLSIEDDDYLNYTQRGEILLSMNLYSDSVAAFDQALELLDDGEIRFRKSYVLFLCDEFEQSLEELYLVAQLDPSILNSASFYIGTGHNFMGIQNTELAINEFSTAIQMEPNNPNYRKYRAECYFDIKRYDLAKEDVLKWLEVEPNSPQAYFYLGFIEYELMNLEAAREMFEQSTTLDSAYNRSYLYLAFIHYAWLQYDECEAYLVKWATQLYANDEQVDIIESIYALEGIDQSLLERVVLKLSSVYGNSVYES